MHTYSARTAGFLKREKDSFANPVGKALSRGTEALFDALVDGIEEAAPGPLSASLEEIIKIRKEITKALEIARKEKVIGHSLNASVTLGVTPKIETLLNPYKEELRTICIVSAVHLVPTETVEGAFESEDVDGLRIRIAPSEDPKCERCWVHDPTVGENNRHITICKRCVEALNETRSTSE